jgi:hypothetical protein
MTDQSAEPPAADPATSLAERAGVDRAFVVELVDGGVLTPAAEGAFSEGAPRTPFLYTRPVAPARGPGCMGSRAAAQ